MATLYRVNLPNGGAMYPCDNDGLSPKEREFLKTRKIHVRKKLKKLLGDVNTDDESKVPLIGILGSGGGMRAAIAYGGAINALQETGLLDVVTYAASLSGSTWYLSHLYGLEKWPDSSPRELSGVLKDQLEKVSVRKIISKDIVGVMGNNRVSGQQSTLVDIFGPVLAEILEPQAKDAVLSDEEKKEALCQCTVPLPLYSAIIVKPTVDAGKFHEWVEFSPYEFTMPKYGVSMNLKSFNKKQQSTESGDEKPEEKLDYLQGIWGSAFAILASELQHSKQEAESDESSYGRDMQYGEVLQQAMVMKRYDEEIRLEGGGDEVDGVLFDGEGGERCGRVIQDTEPHFEALSYEEAVKLLRQGLLRADIAPTNKGPLRLSEGQLNRHHAKLGATLKDQAVELLEEQRFIASAEVDQADLAISLPGHTIVEAVKSVIGFLKKAWGLLKTRTACRAGRAAEIFSAIHGLPVEPIKGMPIADDELFQPYGVEEKEVEIVDAGLAFNLPFPPLLRRKVKLILSFEFSARKTDDSNPLKVLKEAEAWAKKHKMPFPEIDATLFATEGMKEVYVFEDEKNPDCPIILHFPLVNSREDFSIFPDGYPTTRISYEQDEFDRLFNLMDRNVRGNVEVIKDTIRRCINKSSYGRQNWCVVG